MERVQSKHLFKCQLDGVLDKEVLESQKEAMEKLGSGKKSQETEAKQDDEGTSFQTGGKKCQEFAESLRSFIIYWMNSMKDDPILVAAIKNCINTKFHVPPRDGNDYSVPVLVHTPKRLESTKENPAVIFAHGGGVVSGSAEIIKPWLANMADKYGAVYFNVDYRLAPETKCPKNALDFYCAVKHIIEHAAEFGVDPKRIAIAGESGGGYIVMATMVMMAQKDEGHLVKLAIPAIPMIDDYHFGDPKGMTKEENGSCDLMRKVWECIATDLDEQRKNSDPLLFPAKADDDLLAKMPPTIIWEVEFDIFITEATRMARRLRSAGRLLELYIAPGVTHGADFDLSLKVTKRSMDDYKLALETYLF